MLFISAIHTFVTNDNEKDHIIIYKLINSGLWGIVFILNGLHGVLSKQHSDLWYYLLIGIGLVELVSTGYYLKTKKKLIS